MERSYATYDETNQLTSKDWVEIYLKHFSYEDDYSWLDSYDEDADLATQMQHK